MNIAVRKANDATLLDLTGPLMMGEPVQALRNKVLQLLIGGTVKVAINLAGICDLDSSGLGALVAAAGSIDASGGKCKFFAAPKQVVQAMRRAHLDGVFDLHEDEGSALSSF